MNYLIKLFDFISFPFKFKQRVLLSTINKSNEKMSSQTSLARQLNRLKTPQTSLFTVSKVKESFLYDAKQAATIDSDTHFSIALSGLNELTSIDSTITEFQMSILFKETAKSIDRSTLSKQENEDLSKEIEHFLNKVVSPYFLMTATHKCLEWLIFKFHIHKFNVNDLLFAILPYHETRYFTRCIQISDLNYDSNGDSSFYWLESLKKTGSILVKTTLHAHLNKHLEILRELVNKLIKLTEEAEYDTTLWISFLTSTLISILDKNGINENFLIVTIQYVSNCFNLTNNSLTISAYLILTYLATKAQLEKTKLRKILRKMENNYRQFTSNKPRFEFVYCLSTICLHQNLNKFSDQLTDLLLEEDLIRDCDLKTPHLLSSVINNLASRMNEENVKIILDLLSLIKPSNLMINSLIKTIVDTCEDDNNQAFEHSTELMKLIERRYPNQFDESIENLDQNEVAKILNSDLYLKLDEGNIKLSTAINHPNSKIRLASLDLLKDLENYELLDLNSKDIIYNSVKQMIIEQDRKVLSKLLDVNFLDKILTKQDLIDCSSNLFAKCNLKINENSKPDSWMNIRSKLFNLLIKLDYDEDQFLNLFSRLLFANCDNELVLLAELLKSKSTSKLDFVQFLKKNSKLKKELKLENLLKSTADYILKDNQLSGQVNFSFLDKLIKQDNNYNLICALSINSLVLNDCRSFEQINECANNSVKILNNLLIQPTMNLISSKEENSSVLIKNQLKLVDNNQLIIEFVCDIIKKLIQSVEFNKEEMENSEDYYMNSIFNLLFSLVNRSSSKKEFKQLLISFIDKCNNHTVNQPNYDYFISLWINDDSLLQSRSLAICSQILKGYQLTDYDTLHLLIALSSPSIDIHKLALKVLLIVDVNSNDLINLSIKNSNELSYAATFKLFPPNADKLRNLFLNLSIKQLNDQTSPINLVYGLLNLISKEFTSVINLLKPLNNLSNKLLNKKEELSKKENEILALLFTVYCNYFGDERNYQIQNEINKSNDEKSAIQNKNIKVAIQTFCKIIEQNGCIKEFVYSKLKKQWMQSLKSRTLVFFIINVLLNDFLSTGNENAKSKLINSLNDGKRVSYLINHYTLSKTNSNQLNDKNHQKKQLVECRLPFDANNINWKKVLILLEIIQSKDEIKNSTELLECMCRLMDETKNEEKPSIEYLRQLIIYNIRNCLEQNDRLDVQKLDISILFDLTKSLRLKASRTALLTILNMIAPHFRTEILDNFMLICTYLYDDKFNGQYEMNLIDDTLNTIIPSLLEENDDKIKCQITDSFIDALPDMPSHRVQDLLIKLIKLYNTNNSLWYVLFKLNIRTINGLIFDSDEEGYLNLTKRLTSSFNTTVNLTMMVSIVVRTIQILDKNFKFKEDKFDIEKSDKLNLLLIKQLNVVLVSDTFLNQISIAEWNEVSLDFKNLVEQLILLITKLEQLTDKTQQQEQLYDLVCDTLVKVNNLLPIEEFADILQHLLNNGLQCNYQKTLKVFINKLSSVGNFEISKQSWLNFISSLVSIIRKCSKDQDNEQLLVTGQYSFVALKMISKHLENKEDLHGELVKAIEVTLKVIKNLNLEQPKVFNLFVSGVLCLGKLSCVIENQAIPYISSILQLILKSFERNTDLVNLSCFAVLAKLTKIFPTYLGEFLPEIILKICSLVKRREKLKELNIKLSIVENNIITLIPFRKLIDILNKTYDRLIQQDFNFDNLVHYFKLTESSFKELNTNIKDNIAPITKYIFKIIDLRCDNHSRISSYDLIRLENSSLSVVLKFLPKLKETEFKSFIMKLFDWATKNIETKMYYRLQTFYNLINRLADTVKAVFSVFVTPIIAPNCLKMLSKEFAEDKSIEDEQKHSIVLNVLKSISKSVHYNVRSVLSSKDIECFIDLIINQLDYDYGYSSMYEMRIKDGVSKCVQDLVKNFNDFQMVKSLQMKILAKTKEKNKVKKLYALHVLHQFILANTEEYVTYLPDAVPYLVELYEDDSEDIQRLLVSAFRDIELIINEPISNYL